MALLLIDPESDLLLHIELSPGGLAALAEQWTRLNPGSERDAFSARLGKRVAPVIADCLDWDLRPPTDAQINYAVGVAKKLHLEIPALVLQRRSAMGAFLDAHGVQSQALRPRKPAT
ncbi:hypothetical protein [Stenotrophomonas bentonitica]